MFSQFIAVFLIIKEVAELRVLSPTFLKNTFLEEYPQRIQIMQDAVTCACFQENSWHHEMAILAINTDILAGVDEENIEY